MALIGYAGNIRSIPESVGLSWDEYLQRRGTFLDCRGPLEISKKAHVGFNVWILTQSHSTAGGPGVLGEIVNRGVFVEDGAWVGSKAILVGCRIGAGSVVAAGTVVRGQNVAPGVMVAGNPARVIARWDGKQWAYLPASESGFERDLK